MTIGLDVRQAPLMRIVLVGRSTDEDLDVYHDEVVRVMRRAAEAHRTLVFVIDGREAAPADAMRRRKIATWVAAHSALIKVSVRAMAIVLSNPLQRGVLKALMWLRPYPCPYRIFSSLDEADAWARSLLVPELTIQT